MPAWVRSLMLGTMLNPARVPQLRVLQEFRLKVADTSGAVGRMVARSASGLGQAAGALLTSIDDPRDVAILRETSGDRADLTAAEVDEREALEPFVTSWEPRAWYRSRVSETAHRSPHGYRMAVTGSGINGAANDAPSPPVSAALEVATVSPISQLWIGEPTGSRAGLLVLVGDYGAADADRTWPVELSRRLGVRIYDGRAGEVTHGNQRAAEEVRAH